MEWNMLNETKKLFPHWLDKNENSNFSKHLSILNNQQKDIRHKIRSVDWSRILNKPLQICKTQKEPHKWELEFFVNVPRLKKVNIYKNPTIVDNNVVNSCEVIDGYYHNGKFYKYHSIEITDLTIDVSQDSTVDKADKYSGFVYGENGKYYHDLITDKYYVYVNNDFSETDEDIPQTSLIHSESFIDNYSHSFKYILYENNSNDVIITKLVLDSDNNQKYKTIFDYSGGNIQNNGKYELHIVEEKDKPLLYFNITDEKYYNFIDNEFVEATDVNIVVETDENHIYSRIPLIENEDITPIISTDKYVLEVFTWNDYHFLKGFPEIDYIDYNNNNIIDENERTYDNLNISIEKINTIEYLVFRVHQDGIKLIEIFKDDEPIHIADFIIENYDYTTEETEKQLSNNFIHVYNYNDNEVYYPFLKDTNTIEKANMEVDEYVWRLPITEDEKIYDENGNYELKNKYDLKVTYYDSLHPYDSNYDKTITKTYVCEDSIFYHDISLDVLGAFYNVPRYVFTQPSFETYNEKIDFYSNTYPTYYDSLNEDDYHYQKRLEYYITNYNKMDFPCLELWKYFHIDSRLVNRKVIIAEQDYSYLRNLEADEYKYINELGKNKLESFYLNYDYDFEEQSNLKKPRTKSIIAPEDYLHSRDGILVDENNNYIKDIHGTPIKTNYIYTVRVNAKGEKEYVIDYENASRKIQWYNAKQNSSDYQIRLTDGLKVVPNTRYRLRFCLKKYPDKELKFKVIYKNNDGDIREVEETVPPRKDYDEIEAYEENNELLYTNYKDEWGIECEYICTDFLTLSTGQNIELYLESESDFKISDISLQRIIINHFDSEYMKTDKDYNSCVYDLYADYNEIPSNIKFTNWNEFNKILNRSLPLSKQGYFNFTIENKDFGDELKLTDEIGVYLDNMLQVESSSANANDYANLDTVNQNTGLYEHTYTFNRYVKRGDYEINIKPYLDNEHFLFDDFKIDIKMLEFHEDNTATWEEITIDKFKRENEEEFFRIPFENKSDNTLQIKIYSNNPFNYKNFKLIRKSPLTMEEIKE